MKLPEPFKFNGEGCDDFALEVRHIIAVASDKSISKNIQDPNNNHAFLLVAVCGSSTRIVKMKDGRKWPRLETWDRKIVTDGTSYYNVVGSNFYQRKRRLKNKLMISKHKTYANSMGPKERRKIKSAIRDYLAKH